MIWRTNSYSTAATSVSRFYFICLQGRLRNLSRGHPVPTLRSKLGHHPMGRRVDAFPTTVAIFPPNRPMRQPHKFAANVADIATTGTQNLETGQFSA
jgi:hypothetical protein